MSNDEFYPDLVSDCCGAPGNSDYGICPVCGEHCEFELEVQEEDVIEEPAKPINDMNDPETARAARYLDRFREPEGGW